MSRDFTYPRITFSGFLASVIAFLVLSMIAQGLWPDVVQPNGYLLRAITIILFSVLVFFVAYIIFMTLVNILAIRRITTTDEFLVIKGVMGSTQIRWGEITEFGRYKVRVGAYGFWVQFYVKTANVRDRKIKLCTNHLSGMEELAQIIFSKTASAQFVTIENTAWLPFSKRLEIRPWHRNDPTCP